MCKVLSPPPPRNRQVDLSAVDLSPMGHTHLLSAIWACGAGGGGGGMGE